MEFATASSPHTQPTHSVRQVMLQVLYALTPGVIAHAYFFGWGVLVNIVIACAVALGAEAAMLRLRERPLQPYISDGSAVVTAVLLALALPPLAPWWLTTIGALFAIVVAKHLYGGLGYNPFNPAMAGYVVLLISFPRDMTQWLLPQMLTVHHLDFIETLRVIFTGHFTSPVVMDAITSATPLDTVKTQLGLNRTIGEIRADPLFGDYAGRGWEWIANWYALGGLWLLYKRIITWHIPVGVIGGLFSIALIAYLIDPDSHASALFHVFGGATMLCAFFIATDPVSAATTPRGRLFFGLGIGVLIYIIRTWGGYPDGVAFAVLLMNMVAPTIDYYTKPRVFGERR
jgi:electron transport complex protein RnfD